MMMEVGRGGGGGGLGGPGFFSHTCSCFFNVLKRWAVELETSTCSPVWDHSPIQLEWCEGLH